MGWGVFDMNLQRRGSFATTILEQQQGQAGMPASHGAGRQACLRYGARVLIDDVLNTAADPISPLQESSDEITWQSKPNRYFRARGDSQ